MGRIAGGELPWLDRSKRASGPRHRNTADCLPEMNVAGLCSRARRGIISH